MKVEETAQAATRCGFVALIGAPNVGKSTLINALVGEKVSIVSRKVQTTRALIRGIVIEDNAQIVLIDTPGTGFSRVAGKDKDKAWFGVDQDIHAFTVFVRDFLSKYGRWKSPKYLYGESYGTMRAAGMTLALQRQDIDLNGVILLSQILNFDLSPDGP